MTPDLRIGRLPREDRKQGATELARVREITRRSRDLLRAPLPDTFLGRKTQEPFPKEEKEEEIVRWINSRELQPPE